MVLLHVGEALEDYTQRRAESGLISSLLTLHETVRVVREDLASLVALRKLSIGLVWKSECNIGISAVNARHYLPKKS